MIDSARLELPDFAPGSVWLVGAGPGDPGLLSALALHALDHADLVVCDALVDPVTHRDVNSAVTFVTGHSSNGAVPQGVDWQAIARGSPVIVIYMGLRHLDTIAARLIAAGRAPGEPVAIVSKATTPDQRVLVSTLAEAAAAAVASGIEGPTIIAIGEVVRVHAALGWLGGVGKWQGAGWS